MKQRIDKTLLDIQQEEIDGSHIYRNLAKKVERRDPDNGALLRSIADDEKNHYEFWKDKTGTELKPRWFRIGFYTVISYILGITFALKLMERGEVEIQEVYGRLGEEVSEAHGIMEEENRLESYLIGLIKEEGLEYIGSIVLGMNDALVELTGALAGYTFALQNTQLIAVAGLITGIAASLSMAASEYLSNRSEGRSGKAVKSAVYTGFAYIVTVILLILPFFLLENHWVCLSITLAGAVLIILFFTYYISVAKGLRFWRRFGEMAGLSLGVAAVSFGIGILVRTTLGIDL
jgi:VIT1/CCC1 family predicted Fe2+/Mn2+ transporter